MIRVRSFNDMVAARIALDFLRINGISARILNEHIHQGVGGLGTKFTSLDLVVATRADQAEAERLLDELEASPPQLDVDWEDRTAPDLSQLDPASHPIWCPNCAESLPLDETASACPACGADIDPVALLIKEYGPEALELCYDTAPPVIDPGVRATLTCPACSYSLRDLPDCGRCPECGQLYDKQQMEG